MKSALVFLILVSTVSAQTVTDAGERSDYVSDASFALARFVYEPQDHEPQTIADKANEFLASLNDAQRAKAVYPLRSDERRDWTNLPSRPDAGGLPIGECSEAQVTALCELMATLLSRQGFDKMRDIMLADDQLLRGGRPRVGFGTEQFAVVLFGEPSITGPWAFQLDGHHVGVNVSMEGDQMSLSPSFIGTQPESFQIAGKEYRPLAGEIDVAFALVNSLDEQQRAQAIVSDRRQRIRSGPGRDGQIPTAQGVACSTFSDAQRARMLELIGRWIGNLPPKHAERRMAELRDGFAELRFAWHGPTDPVSDVSYAIQGPSLIIEYACQDLGGNPLNHLHTMYRNPRREYGGQLEN